MNPIELAHEFLADLLRLPLVFQLFLLYGAGAAVWKWWKARQKSQLIAASTAWPVYRARVVWAQVSDRKKDGRHGPVYWEGLLTYSYTVPGHDLEVGEHRKRFDEEEEADSWARALRDTFVNVRVNPTDVTRSVWQETPILTAPSPRMPELDAARHQGAEGWGTREILAAIIFLVAAGGALFAAWIQLSCLTGKTAVSFEKNAAVFFGMHIGCILCTLAAGLLGQKGKWSQSALQRSLKAGTKGVGMKILGAYTTIVFLYGWVRMGAQDGDAGYLGTLMFSACWLIMYAGAATISLQAMQGRENKSHGL